MREYNKANTSTQHSTNKKRSLTSPLNHCENRSPDFDLPLSTCIREGGQSLVAKAVKDGLILKEKIKLECIKFNGFYYLEVFKKEDRYDVVITFTRDQGNRRIQDKVTNWVPSVYDFELKMINEIYNRFLFDISKNKIRFIEQQINLDDHSNTFIEALHIMAKDNEFISIDHDEFYAIPLPISSFTTKKF